MGGFRGFGGAFSFWGAGWVWGGALGVLGFGGGLKDTFGYGRINSACEGQAGLTHRQSCRMPLASTSKHITTSRQPSHPAPGRRAGGGAAGGTAAGGSRGLGRVQQGAVRGGALWGARVQAFLECDQPPPPAGRRSVCWRGGR